MSRPGQIGRTAWHRRDGLYGGVAGRIRTDVVRLIWPLPDRGISPAPEPTRPPPLRADPLPERVRIESRSGYVPRVHGYTLSGSGRPVTQKRVRL